MELELEKACCREKAHKVGHYKFTIASLSSFLISSVALVTLFLFPSLSAPS